MNNKLHKFLLIGLIYLLMALNGFADFPELFVPRVSKPPVLDGQISDGEWDSSAKSGKFMILGLKNAATEQTQAFIMRDDKNLYVAFRCDESQIDKIKAVQKERNSNVWEDDDVEFFISKEDTPSSYHQFMVNSIGTCWDTFNGKESDWQARSYVGTDFWSVEMAIPFSYLGAEEGMIFRGHFCRSEKPKSENSAWPVINSGMFADFANSAWIVFGAYKAVALRETEKLIKKIEALSVADFLSVEKTGILDETRKLAEGIKSTDKLTLSGLREKQKLIALLDDREIALETKTIQERFAASASGTIYLTSDTSHNRYELSKVWATQKILGKDFWFDIIHWPEIWKKAGLENEPFIKDAFMRFELKECSEKEFENMFFNSQSWVYQTLKQSSRPFTIRGIGNTGPIGMSPAICQRFIAEYGKTFVGFMADECFGHNPRKHREAMGLPLARTRYEAYLGFVAAYLAPDNRFHSWSLTIPEFRPLTSCGTATYLDHWILELGAPFTGEEIGGFEICTPMQFAVSRGAARQYGKIWRTYLAVWTSGLSGPSNPQYCFLSPECRASVPYNAVASYDSGPYCGSSLSLQRRELYAAYMSGVNIIRDEDDCLKGSLYIANYDYRDIDQINPLVKVLRDRPYCLSPAGAVRKELYDNIVKKHDRGIAYTPVGLIFDRYHGFIPEYDSNNILGVLPYAKGDYMMRAINNALFPWEQGTYTDGKRFQCTGPYGDIFDVLTNNARPETLQAYRALLLVGDVTLDKLFAQRLIDYVKDGGTLLINVKQTKESLLPETFLGCKILKEHGEGRIGYSFLDNAVIIEQKSFAYQKIKPISAKPLILCVDEQGQENALVTINNYGKGKVILTAPDYLIGSKNQMLNIFGYLMAHLRDELLPVKWEGNVEVLINRNSKGWIVTLINNEGSIKRPGEKEIFNKTKEIDVWLNLNEKAGEVTEILEWTENKKVICKRTEKGTEVKVTVPPGSIRILEFLIN